MREKEEEDRGRVHESRVAVVAVVPATGGACDENGTPRGAAADESKASGIGVIDREDCGGDGGKGTSPAAAAAEDDGILSLAPPLRPPAYADLVSDPSDLLRIKPDVAAAILASRHRPEGKKPWEEDRDDDFARDDADDDKARGDRRRTRAARAGT